MNKSLRNFLLFLSFFAATLALYIQTIHSKFTFDFINLALEFQKNGWSGLGNFSTGFSPYYVAKFIFFALLKIFRFNVCGWYVVTCALHAANAVLLFHFIEKMLKQFNHAHSFTVAFIATVAFLISPYHTEAIVWGGAFNYLIVGCLILLHLNALYNFFGSEKISHAIVVSLSYGAAVFTHEWGLFLIPADALLFLLLYRTLSQSVKGKVIFLTMPVFLFTAYYFINQLILGELIGHYGAGVHLNFKLAEMVQATYKYLLKILLFSGFWGVDFQTKVYSFIQHTTVEYLLASFLLLVGIASVFVIVKRKKKYAASAFFFLLFCFFVFPVLNLYFPYWIKIHADRYCYLPVAFLCTAILSLFLQWTNSIKFIFSAVFIFLSIFFLRQNNFSWHEAGELQQKLETDFKWWNAKHVYLLNVPDNFRGAYMYRNKYPSAFAGSFIKNDYSIPQTDITEVLNYNLNAFEDSVIIEKVNQQQLKVTLSGAGTWWWRNTLGATDYETDEMKVDVDDYNYSYVVEFKKKVTGDIFLYQANGKWCEVRNF